MTKWDSNPEPVGSGTCVFNHCAACLHLLKQAILWRECSFLCLHPKLWLFPQLQPQYACLSFSLPEGLSQGQASASKYLCFAPHSGLVNPFCPAMPGHQIRFCPIRFWENVQLGCTATLIKIHDLVADVQFSCVDKRTYDCELFLPLWGRCHPCSLHFSHSVFPSWFYLILTVFLWVDFFLTSIKLFRWEPCRSTINK